MQLLPGVQSGTEGSAGIYVRGGGMDSLFVKCMASLLGDNPLNRVASYTVEVDLGCADNFLLNCSLFGYYLSVSSPEIGLN